MPLILNFDLFLGWQHLPWFSFVILSRGSKPGHSATHRMVKEDSQDAPAYLVWREWDMPCSSLGRVLYNSGYPPSNSVAKDGLEFFLIDKVFKWLIFIYKCECQQVCMCTMCMLRAGRGLGFPGAGVTVCEPKCL